MLQTKTTISRFNQSCYVLIPKELMNDSQFPIPQRGKDYSLSYDAKKRLLMVRL